VDKRFYPFLILILAIIACNAPAMRTAGATDDPPPATIPPLVPLPTPTPEVISVPPTEPPAFNPDALTEDWQTIQSGLDVRIDYVPIENRSVEAYLVRVDPALLDVRVHYDKAIAQPLADWHNALPDAVFVVNGGFFERSRDPVGLVGLEGFTYGISLDAHGGMLTINGDQVLVRSLAQVPYQEGEAFNYAVQGRPMLVYPGGFPVSELEGLPADATRRTAVAQDIQGRLIFVVVDFGAVTIWQFRDYLASIHDTFELHAAFNLDGGGSTGMSIRTPTYERLINSQSRLYSTIAVYPKPDTP